MLETRTTKRWLTASGLAYLTLLMYPDTLPRVIPQPKAGATKEQARGWAALWLAGQRAHFPTTDGDPNRRTRSRRVAEVLGHLANLMERARFERSHRG